MLSDETVQRIAEKHSATPRMAKVIADHRGYRITRHHLSSHETSKVIVAFDGIDGALDSKGSINKFALSSGYDVIHVSQAPRTQYQQLSLEDFERYVRPEVSGKEVFTYGYSLGGYCAIYYAGTINAKAIAFSPRNSAHPLIARGSHKKLNFNHVSLEVAPKSKRKYIINFDPCQPIDVTFIDNLIRPYVLNAHFVAYPYAGM